MIGSKLGGAVALALCYAATPAMATSFVTDPIVDPSSQWAGIDYWGVQVSQFSNVDQTLTFTIPQDSRIDIYMGGSSKFQFSDILLDGSSIASDFTLGGGNTLMASGYAAAGQVSLRFLADYDCPDCWGDWFGGYVQVTQADMPAQPSPDGVPEPATWAMMVAGLLAVGAAVRRGKVRPSFA